MAAWTAAHASAANCRLRGGRLLARAATAFIVPIVGATAGAILAGADQRRQFVGMWVGLVAAMAASAAVGRLIHRQRRQREEPT